MDSVAIANIITHKKGVTSLEVSELKHLADSYPYAQIFTIFYLKALAETKNLAFDTELNKYAYRVTDRVKLYEIIQAKEESTAIIPQVEIEEDVVSEIIEAQQEEKHVEIDELETVSEIVEVPQEENYSEIRELEKVNETSIEEEIINEVIEENSEIQEEPKIEEKQEEVILQKEVVEPIEIIDEIEDTEVVIEEKAREDAMDTLERSILSNAINTAFSHIIESESLEKQKEELELVEDEVEQEEEIPTNEIETPSNKDDIGASLHTFSGWLTKGKIESPITNEEVTIAKNESEKQAEDKKGALIDRFIEKKPTISRPKTEFFSAPKKAQESVDDSSLLYSETLANIYVIQGNFPLAIKAYEQLCLTIPEKRMIFAEKIEELRFRLKNLK